ncbi:MAG TPA: nitroreductase [Acidimicrobiales bacterium]|jgi:nitroreductase|nr:nitroreductase [Acidimicrobiales bacterium]
MDAYEAIVSKRDTREFTDEPVSSDDLQKILQAGRMAGSAKNSQGNRIVVVTDAHDRARLAECGTFADWIPRAPVALVLVAPKDADRPFDHGRMAQNMMVTAHALGLGSCPVTFHDPACVAALLGIPDDYEAPMGIGLGHPAPAGPARQSSPRIPLDELVKQGRWS